MAPKTGTMLAFGGSLLVVVGLLGFFLYREQITASLTSYTSVCKLPAFSSKPQYQRVNNHASAAHWE
jgi:hypothetical protein